LPHRLVALVWPTHIQEAVIRREQVWRGVILANQSPVPVREQLRGLTDAEVAAQRRRFGENALPAPKGPTAWSILLEQFKSPLVYIILVAAAISLAVGEQTDFAIIIAVLVIDVTVGFIQEYQAQRTYTALRGLLKPTTTVIREGHRQEVEARELVPGDLVVMSTGDRIPADAEVVESARLSVNEGILTGESEPVGKSQAPEQNMVYMGTTVVAGRGLMRVTRIGASTELGQIAASLQEREEKETPLQVRLSAFSRSLAILVLVATATILAVGVASGRSVLEMLRVSIVLAIAAVPEGLLIAVTVVLVLGQRRILRRNGLVKKLLAVETLGSVTVICTDKTGTLTEGLMRVTRTDFASRDRALETMVLCNDLESPLEVALWEYARTQLPDDPQLLYDRSERLAEEPFSSESKFMVTANRLDGGAFNFLKGAPEIVLGMSQLTAAEQARILGLVDRWAGEGLRTLGLAYRPLGLLEEHSGYTWAGLVGMQDPVRPAVPEAIALAHTAGVQVKMITGDYRRTAERVARGVGLEVDGEQVIEGSELAALDDQQLRAHVERIAVFSRIRPQDKLRIVRALQANGEIVAMIGDGVNDAPALRQANIGVVVGSATDVAKEEAGLILLDNNFATIVAAIEEGRVIFDNIRKVVSYTLSNSFAEALAIFAAILLRFPAPLTVAQILWVHLICDGPSDIVLGFEPAEAGIMREKPRPLQEPILSRLGFGLIGAISFFSALFALSLFSLYWLSTANLALGRTLAYASLAVNSLIYIFGYRSLRRPILRYAPLAANRPLIVAVLAGLALAVGAVVAPPLRRLLGTVPLSALQWGLTFGLALILLGIVELAKYVNARLQGPRAGPAIYG